MIVLKKILIDNKIKINKISSILQISIDKLIELDNFTCMNLAYIKAYLVKYHYIREDFPLSELICDVKLSRKKQRVSQRRTYK